MKIRIIAVGKIKEEYLQDGITEYTRRLHPYIRLGITEIPEGRRPASPSPAQEALIKEHEGERILAAFGEGGIAVALDPRGEPWSSEYLAERIRASEIGGRDLVFIIGGDIGLAERVLARASFRVSLSAMTFTHQMARLILLEQIYRAFRIIRGEPYHR